MMDRTNEIIDFFEECLRDYNMVTLKVYVLPSLTRRRHVVREVAGLNSVREFIGIIEAFPLCKDTKGLTPISAEMAVSYNRRKTFRLYLDTE